jgi:2-dehydro-3-deoxyphosphogalactonate aldolase
MKFEMIAILRGVQPNEVLDIASCLFDSGFDVVEVPLNSQMRLNLCGYFRKQFPERLVGAGTVLNNAQVNEIAKVRGRLIVTPNCNKSVIGAAKIMGSPFTQE